MKAIKKCLSVILAFTIITSILCIIPIEVKAASNNNEDWKGKYIEYINSLSSSSSNKSFALIDLDGNGIPELLFDSGSYLGGKTLSGITKGEINTVIIGGAVFRLGNLVYCYTGQMGFYRKIVYEINNGSIECLFDGKQTAKNITDFNMDNPDDFIYSHRYRLSDDYSTISYNEFNRLLSAVFDEKKAQKIEFQYNSSNIINAINNFEKITDWKQIYTNYINQCYATHSRRAVPEYALAQINDDSTPELILRSIGTSYAERSYWIIWISDGQLNVEIQNVEKYKQKSGKFYSRFRGGVTAHVLEGNEIQNIHTATWYGDYIAVDGNLVDEATCNAMFDTILDYGDQSPEYKSKEQIIKEINEYGVSTPNIDTLKEYEKFCAKSYSGYSNLIPDLKMTYKEIEENYEPLQKYVNNLLSFGWEAKFAFKDSAQIWETVIIDIILKNGTSSENMLHTEKDAYEIAKSFADYVKEAGIEDLAKPVGLNKPSVKAFVKEINDSIDLGSMDFLDKCDVCMEAADTLADFLDNYSNFVAVYKTVNINMKSFISALKTSQLYSDVGAFRRAVDDICANISVDPFKLIENAMKKATLDHLLSYTVKTTAGIVVKVLLGPKAFAAVEFAKYGTIYLMDTLMNVGQISKNNVYLYIIDKIDDAASETFKRLASECKNSDGEKNTKEVIGGVEFFDSLYTYGISICRNWTDAISVDILTAMESGPQFTVKRPHYDLATDYLNLGHASTKNEKTQYVLKRCEDDEKNINNYFNCITNGIIANWYNNLGGTSNYNIKLINYIVKTPLNEEDKYSQLVNNNTTFKTPSVRSKTGYKLSPVWYLDEECTISVPSNYVITENVSFYNRYVPTIFTALTSDGTGLVITNMGGGGFRSINSVGVNVNTSEIGSDDAGIIPPYISGYRVLELGDDIFCNQGVTSVSIPSTVVSISQNCFKSLSQDTKFIVVANSYAEKFLNENDFDIDSLLGIIGDPNLDGVIDISDATTIQMYIAKMIDYGNDQTNASDTNGDKLIDISDATMIQMYVAEKIIDFGQQESITLNHREIAMTVGEKTTLTATLKTPDSSNKSISWESSNKTIADVSEGVVSAKSPGTATITAKSSGGKTAACIVTVKAVEVISISLNQTSLSLYEGDSYQLIATINPSNATDNLISWATSSPAVATIDSNGRIKANSSGTAIISAKTSNGRAVTCELTVLPVLSKSVTISDGIKEVDVNDKFTLTANISPSNTSNKSLTWSSSNTSVATVSALGEVNAIHNGKTVITATTINGKSASCEVEVYQPISGSLSLTLFMNREPNGYARLTEDFTINSMLPICDTEFMGCLNGDNHTITYDYSITQETNSSSVKIALLSKTNGATIKNLKTAGTINYQIEDNSCYDAFVAGFVASAQSTMFENCTNETRITSTIQNGSDAFSYTGGICARCESSDFINCTNKGLIKSYAKLSGISLAYVGGIAGEAYSSRINNCSNSGNMLVYSGKGDGTSVADATIGGIIGSSTNYTSVSECLSSGNLFAYSHPEKNSSTYPSTSATGGIVGTGLVSINNCSSTCTLYPTAYNGGETYKGELIAY